MTLKTSVLKAVTEVDKFLPKALFYSFIMSKKEKELFDKRIKKSNTYLEFGMGGSTFRTLQKSDAKVYSIDSSLDWISFMREYKQIRKMEKTRLSLFHVDIGPTGEWGRPENDNYKEKFPNYSKRIFELIDKTTVDTVLIDGRFRVACALNTILHLHENKNLQILIHDFWNREQYHMVLKYFDEAESADSLVVLTIKKDVDLNAVKEDYETYKYHVD